MIIEKEANKKNTSRINELFYSKARLGMNDVINEMYKKWLVDKVLLPGYIGWSPREGSGIFDSISSIHGITIDYYKMKTDLMIDSEDLLERIDGEKTLVLIVNYFGFRDPDFSRIIGQTKAKRAWIMEDNAHGFFTWHENDPTCADIVVFSLHKMFPFAKGGSIILQNELLAELELHGEKTPCEQSNPYSYHIYHISKIRRENYIKLHKLLRTAEEENILYPLRDISFIENCVPQTYPVVLKIGNRDKIYELMNDSGYGVVSLYHTLIDPLQNEEYQVSLDLSKKIMNLPVHQDIDASRYPEMVSLLIEFCKKTQV